MAEEIKKSESPEQAKSAAKTVGQLASGVAQDVAMGVAQSGRSASETLRGASEASGETLRHLGPSATRATANASERVIDAQRDYFSGMAAQVERSANELAQAMEGSARDWRALFDIGSANGSAFQHFQRSMTRAFDTAMRANLRTGEELFRLAGPLSVAGIQQRVFRNFWSSVLDSSAGVMRGVQQSTEQALHPLEERLAELDEHWRESPRVADVMQRDVQTVNSEDTVQQAARLMADCDAGALPVREGDQLVGMVTDRDVALRIVAQGKDSARTKVREVMTSHVRYVFEDEDIEHVVGNMAEQQVRRLPVMNRRKRLVGVVSLGDIAKASQANSAGRALAGIAKKGGQHTQAAE